MVSFGEFFNLARPERTSFLLSPERDAEILVDVEGQGLRAWMERCFQDQTAPRGAIYGEIGLGKSHLLRHIELTRRAQVHCLYVTLSGFERRSSFVDVHHRVAQHLAPLVEDLAPRMQAGWASQDPGLGRDARTVFELLAQPDLKPETRGTLRAWLIGMGPTPTQARKLGLSGRLVDGVGPSELVALWKAIGRLHLAVEKRPLVLLLDESESFRRITDGDGLASLGQGYRELVDADNNCLGCFFGINLPSVSVAHPLGRSDVASRLDGGRVLALEPLAQPPRTEKFVHEFWRQLSRGPALLEPDALSWVAANLRSLRSVVVTDPRELDNLPTPRDLLKLLSHIGQHAWQEGVRPPLSHRWVSGLLVGRRS